ncbi:MAG: glycogen synthase [Nitrospirae bacterium]|nr:glycogen synthase [Nitrospirota bacterium]
MKILIATPEAVPFAKTGGLVYKRVKEAFNPKNTGVKVKVPVGNQNFTGKIYSKGTSVYFIKRDEFFDREDLYGTPQGDYADNAARFIFFSRGILEACKALKIKPDIIHCHDWQTGLVPLYLKTIYKPDKFFNKTSTVITVHNLGYQGLFSPSEMPLTGLDRALFNPEGIEFYGKINFLKAGLISADLITAVSDNYSKEILNKEYGFGLEGVLKKRSASLSGIINGIDYGEWNPKTDIFIAKKYSDSDIAGKRECKQQLLKDCFIKPNAEMPVVGMVGRLSSQKGLDLVLESIEGIVSTGAYLIIIGKGDEMFHKRLSETAEKYKGNIHVKIGFNDALAHKIYAGSDIFLMPSKYEPCGLGQMIAMRYGTIPVVRKTGGLADTVSDYEPLIGAGTGFLFEDYNRSALQDCLKRAMCVYVDKPRWQNLIRNAMKMDFSWNASAKKYVNLFRKAIKMKQ